MTDNQIPVNVTVNGKTYTRNIDGRLTLVDFIRDELDLTGTHVGCRTGDCGACTVTINGKVAKSCLSLAAGADGANIRTIEGIDGGSENLTPVQSAFWNEFGFQCGYCLPGMLFCAEELLEDNTNPSEEEIRKAIDGNLCRCTGYHGIVRAVRAAADSKAAIRAENDRADQVTSDSMSEKGNF